MATPTYAEMLKGATTWRETHKNITFTLSHHGYLDGTEYDGARPGPGTGTWCYYLIIPEQMFPHRWADFAARLSDNGFFHHGPAWDAVSFDSEITWASSEPYFDRKVMKQFDAAKVGCDYAHLWHAERGYPDTFNSVRGDAIRTVESFLSAHSDGLARSDYSGLWGTKDEVYTAINGRTVHRKDDLPDGWESWREAVA